MISKEKVLISRINKVERLESGTVQKTAGKDFSRGKHHYNCIELIQREIQLLKVLAPYAHFPKIIDTSDQGFTMNYAGERLSRANLPTDWVPQIENILSTLEKEEIIHRDIKAQNILVLEGIITLIDFGWAIQKKEGPYVCPQDLCADIPKERIYNNRTALFYSVQNL